MEELPGECYLFGKVRKIVLNLFSFHKLVFKLEE